MKLHRKKLIAVASTGGHWVQLMRLKPSFSEFRTYYVTSSLPGARTPQDDLLQVKDANLKNKWALFLLAIQAFWILVKIRPDVVISTGAAPGFLFLVFGRLFRAKTIWIDSIANSEELSLAGLKIRRWCDVCFTQWPDISEQYDVEYLGSVI